MSTTIGICRKCATMTDNSFTPLCDKCAKSKPFIATTTSQAGYCGKCGAPYFFDNQVTDFPRPRPTCACWNLPMTRTTTGSNT